MLVRVYSGFGSGRNGVPLLIKELRSHLDCDVEGITQDEMKTSEGWKKETSTLIFAGRSVTDFKAALGEKVLTEIPELIHEGAFDYAGICAGAAFGVKTIKYRIKPVHSESDIILRNTGISVFNGAAIGPSRSVCNIPFNGGFENLHLIDMYSLTDNTTFNAFHWGGPALIPFEDIRKNNGQIISCLKSDGTPMSLRVAHGQGSVSLFSYHPEIHAGNIGKWVEGRSMTPEDIIRLEQMAEKLDGSAFIRFLEVTRLKRKSIITAPAPIRIFS